MSLIVLSGRTRRLTLFDSVEKSSDREAGEMESGIIVATLLKQVGITSVTVLLTTDSVSTLE